MQVTKSYSVSAQPAWRQAVIFLTGLFYTLVGLLMLVAPAWFFESIGHFPPFNRHYIGDLAAFILPLGGGLLLVAREPYKHRLFLWVVGSANLLHGLNHLYDSVTGPMSFGHWLSDTIPLFVGTILFFIAIWPRDQA